METPLAARDQWIELAKTDRRRARSEASWCVWAFSTETRAAVRLARCSISSATFFAPIRRQLDSRRPASRSGHDGRLILLAVRRVWFESRYRPDRSFGAASGGWPLSPTDDGSGIVVGTVARFILSGLVFEAVSQRLGLLSAASFWRSSYTPAPAVSGQVTVADSSLRIGLRI